jgi:eukaryotic-like serine/threonine-protein kinase
VNRTTTPLSEPAVTDESVFAAALEIPDPTERAAFLDRACSGNPALRAELDALLAAHAGSNPLDRPPAGLARTGAYEPEDDGPPPAAVGDRIGPYILREQIGEGGFGLVFVAEQTDPVRRKVALKVLKPGMDTRDVVARFEAERQALALMDHPNIARILDAGSTPAGRPYFVMELVRGVPVTDFCDAQKLPPKARLALFVAICQAVQHAHQKGVIHRDLKPSNILVTSHDGVPVPKVIDFGVAKAIGQSLTEKTIYTRFAQMIGTPLYMSPEQAELSALDVDTRSDVYALGVLLYELLTGTTPFDRDRFRRAAFDEIRRIIREEEPPRPSTRLTSLGATLTAVSASRGTDAGKLAGIVRGELDWIVMRCLEKDRNRRYESANGLARDVQRYLANEPVDACPPTLGYRLRKYVQKNGSTLAVAMGILISLLFVTGFSLWQAGRARIAEIFAKEDRDEAERQQQLAARDRDVAIEAGKETARQRDETKTALGKLSRAQEEQQASQYGWDIKSVPIAFEAGQIDEVNRLLDRHIPAAGQADRRGFEWFYWDRRLHTEIRTDQLPDVGTSSNMRAASPDGSRVGQLGSPPTRDDPSQESWVLAVWDTATRKVLLKHQMSIKRPVDLPNGFSIPETPLLSKDGKRIAVECSFPSLHPEKPTRELLQVLDVASGKVLIELEDDYIGRLAPVKATRWAFSPDGRRFAAVCRMPGSKPDKESRGVPVHVRVWNLDKGTEAGPPLDADELADSPFHAEGSRLVTWKRRDMAARVSVWDVGTGKERAGWNVSGTGFDAMACSPDGSRVAAVAGDPAPVKDDAKSKNPLIEPQVVKLWDTATGKEVYALSLVGLRGNGQHSARVFFSPDSSRMAVSRGTHSAESSESDFTVWDTTAGKPLPRLLGADGVRWWSGATFSPDGQQIVLDDGNVVRSWDTETGRPLLTLRGHVNPIDVFGFTPDGRRLWTLEVNGPLKVWDMRPPGPLAIPFANPRFPEPSTMDFAISLDGGRVAAVIIKNGREIADGVGVWDTSGKSVRNLVLPPWTSGPNSPILAKVYRLALSRGGRRALLFRADPVGADQNADPPELMIWDVDSGTVVLRQVLERQYLLAMAISPDGRTVASVSLPAMADAPLAVRIFDVENRRESKALPVPEGTSIFGLTFSPDGRRLAGLGSVSGMMNRGNIPAQVIVWSVESGSRICVADTGSQGQLIGGDESRFAWAPDGSRFACSESSAGTEVTVYDAITGKSLATMERPFSGVRFVGKQPSIAFSPDGKRIAGFVPDLLIGGTPHVTVWDAASGTELLSLPASSNGNFFATRFLTFTGDGHRLVLTEQSTKDAHLAGQPQSGIGSKALLVTTWDATPVPGREPVRP